MSGSKEFNEAVMNKLREILDLLENKGWYCVDCNIHSPTICEQLLTGPQIQGLKLEVSIEGLVNPEDETFIQIKQLEEW